MATAHLPRIHCFRAGRHQPMVGSALDFSASDLAASVAAYDPAVFRAPIVVGHPKLDDPAFGWVDKLSLEADGLYADPGEVDAQFADLVKDGRYKKVSVRWFTPAARNNPVPGVYYLRHVGFLGATPPAVLGLKSVEFADDDTECITIEFADAPAWPVARLFRGLRDWLIGNHDLATADSVLPAYQIEELENAARQVDDAPHSPVFSAAPITTQGDSMSPEEKARLDALEAENARLKAEADALKTQSAEFADREAALQAKEAAALQAEIADFADGLIKAGKVLPRDKAGLVAYLAGADDAGAIEFADGENTVNKPADEWLRNFLSALPAQVDFAERGAGGSRDDASFADAADPVAVAARAVEYQQAERAAGRQVNTAQAVAHVSRNSAQT